MAKIMILAESGFGKTSSIGKIEEISHEGLNPSTTFIISTTSKPLPWKGSGTHFKVTTPDKLDKGNRVITNDSNIVAALIKVLGDSKSPYKNIVIDDFNYLMQDFYMKNALKNGWDTPKQIGVNMNSIYEAIESVDPLKHVIIMAHYEEYNKVDGKVGVRMKTTGKMVNEYITPEGKADILLFGKSSFDEKTKTSIKEFVTNDDGIFTAAKSPIGMFDKYIPNDLGYVIKKIEEYYN